MKLRDSGMPDEAYWESLFDVPLVLARLGIDGSLDDVAELGCGYGTFSMPVARAIRGRLYTFDIDPAMVARTRERADELPPGKVGVPAEWCWQFTGATQKRRAARASRFGPGRSNSSNGRNKPAASRATAS
jgi:SAM-dependent methyltransferase